MIKEQQNMMALYIGFLISTILSFLPSYNLQILGFIFFFATLIMTYIYKYRSDINSFQYSHSKYLIKTVWIFSIFLLIGIIIAGTLADNSSINATMNNIMNGQMISEAELENILMGYMKQNAFLFFITIVPSFLYFLYRIFKGIKLIKNNSAVTNPKT